MHPAPFKMQETPHSLHSSGNFSVRVGSVPEQVISHLTSFYLPLHSSDVISFVIPRMAGLSELSKPPKVFMSSFTPCHSLNSPDVIKCGGVVWMGCFTSKLKTSYPSCPHHFIVMNQQSEHLNSLKYY